MQCCTALPSHTPRRARLQLEKAFAALRRDTMRELLLEQRVRPDGRGPGDIRPIAARCGLLPRVHGSALFTRGETQVRVTGGHSWCAQVERCTAAGERGVHKSSPALLTQQC